MFVEEVQQDPVGLLVLLLDVLVLKITTTRKEKVSFRQKHVGTESMLPSGHETVDLVIEPSNNILSLRKPIKSVKSNTPHYTTHNESHLNTLLPLLHSLLILILRRNHTIRNRNTRRIIRINHSRMTSSTSLELGTRLRRQVHDLTAPAETDDAPFSNVGVLAVDLVDDFGNTAYGFWGCAGRVEELAELLAFFLL